MKKLIIISLVLTLVLLFVSLSFAAWNEGGFKNSPLFKHSLKNSVESMENQGNEAAAGGHNGDTKDAKCNNPRAPETASPPCDTWENTCEGEPTCYLGTCEGYTCEGVCNPPPIVSGYVLMDGSHYNWRFWSNRKTASAHFFYPYTKIDNGTFASDGAYILFSDYGYVALVADADRNYPSEHGHGEEAIYQTYQHQYADIDMDEFTG